MTAALELVGIRKSFDGFLALDDAHFRVDWGEVHALLGENGAGKSTLMNVAAGLYAPEHGTISVDGHPVTLSGPRAARDHHIGMVHQHFKLVRPFTVAENILLANPEFGGGRGYAAKLKLAEGEIAKRAAELGFEIDARRRTDSLSIAEQQRAEILKVLLAGARILILDEPTAVLTDREAERLLLTVQALARRGTAVALVTHKMADVQAYADRVTVMRGGKTVATVDPRHTSREELVRLTVGETVRTPERSRATPGEIRLHVNGVRARRSGGHTVLDGVDLQVRAGEIYGIAGVGGNGQSELAEALLGLSLGAGAELTGDIRLHAADSAAPQGAHIAAIPADRYAIGLAASLSIAENFAIGAARTGRYGSRLRLARGKMELAAQAATEAFNVQGVRSVRQTAALLSGGNAQKLVIAREFSKQPALVLAHSPSRGLDVRATSEVHMRLLAARDAGAAVLLISEDLDEVLVLADRIGVMSRGRIVAEFEQPADRQAVGQAMVGHA